MNVAQACQRLAHEGLVQWASGNASERAGAAMYIKPSGVVCSMAKGWATVRLADGRHDMSVKPSTDAEAHRHIYNHLPDVNGIVHTHSSYCTTFACAHWPIPCISTQTADVFGGEIPLSQYCEIGGEDIGMEVVRLYERTHVPAILIRAHGIFTLGKTLEEAVRNAILAEEAATVAWRVTGKQRVIALTPEQIKVNHQRYSESYGQ
jgi:L-ribulose-5-phosphate 4-epimerase